MKLFSVLLMLIPCFTWAADPLDNYYSDDLLDAVSQAKEQPHHYDYSNSYRYKRTTAQSIELNRLNLNELDDTRLSIGQGATDNSEELASNQLENPVDLLKHSNQPAKQFNNQESIQAQFKTSAPLSSSYENSAGSYQSNGIIQSGTVISTPRP